MMSLGGEIVVLSGNDARAAPFLEELVQQLHDAGRPVVRLGDICGPDAMEVGHEEQEQEQEQE